MTPLQEDTQFWQEWGAAKEQIAQIHKAIFNGQGLAGRVARLEKITGRLVTFVFLIGVAGAASAHTFLQGNGSWVPGAVGIGSSLVAIIISGWGLFKN